jgi:integrase
MKGDLMKFTRRRFQHGCLSLEERKSGPDAYIFRWRETDATGGRVNRKMVVGTVETLKTRTAAERAVGALRLAINSDTSPRRLQRLTVGQLVEHYTAKELTGGRCTKSFSTIDGYQSYFKNWILPRWEGCPITDVKAVAVEDWLASLDLAPGSKAKARNMMSAIFNHAVRYEWLERNPITLVRQSAKRLRIPHVLDEDEMKRLLTELEQPVLAMMCLDAATGLRRSELLGLKWGDIDFERLEINLNRGVVRQVVGGLKTEASKKPVSMEPALSELLLDWKSQSAYNGQDDWVFASPVKHGKQPLWPENLLRRYVRPAAARAGITKRIGFHTFRHSLATIMKANGEDVKTVQEILRHANSRITLDIYAQAVTPAKRKAQGKVLEMILPGAKQPEKAANVGEKGTGTA